MAGDIILASLIGFLVLKELGDASSPGLGQQIGQSIAPWLVPLILMLLYILADTVKEIIA